MDVPVYSLAEQDGRWALARQFMAAEEVEELVVVRYCAAAGEAAARAMAAAAAPGVAESAVCAAGTTAAFRLGCPASTLTWSGSGLLAWGAHAGPSRPERWRVLADGDVLLAEITPRFGLKETRHLAAIAVGDPHPDIETAAVIATASYRAGLRAARVGNRLGDLADAMAMPLKQAGLSNTDPLVYVLSAPGSAELPLAPGMCCVLGPSVVVAGHVVRLGGTVVIAEDAPIELSPFTARMLRVPAGDQAKPRHPASAWPQEE